MKEHYKEFATKALGKEAVQSEFEAGVKRLRLANIYSGVGIFEFSFTMLSQIRTHITSWWQQTPLPAAAATPNFQKWYNCDQNRWMPFVGEKASRPGAQHQWAGSFRLVSWNVNADAPLPKSRMSALLQVVKTTGAADVVLLQEVSREQLTALLEDTWIQRDWYMSDIDDSAFGTQKFISITMVSRLWVITDGIQLGTIWRVAFPSRFGRDALCCDLILNSSSKQTSGKEPTRVRLINVHLDSLPINPSMRPRQVFICASYLGAAGRGIIAGDFNCILPEDDDLVSNNGLADAWAELHPNDSGHTWGVYGEQSFPPNRLDKVALLNLHPSAMRILQTSEVRSCGGEMSADAAESGSGAHFSDHLGLWCDVGWAEDRPNQD
ncbi:hypothetical protein J4E83_010504 [Alternaria metachromatica]|uniref:uncharacterized protein n=1 Tax=Alternaria metachromatica TaxID=283354 RepID=UPI0020C44B1C|nr:uncharacterized protein J4E83_010504 [Alternaria metachromatica]KAI4605612.1 hypothetical protein J4E83_010504 [Alternaria metachromatica]